MSGEEFRDEKMFLEECSTEARNRKMNFCIMAFGVLKFLNIDIFML